MKKLSLCTLLLLAGFFYVGAQTVSDKDKKMLEKIKAENAQYKTLSSPFKQTSVISFLGEEMLSKGVCHYSKPEQLAMRYNDPAGDLMLIDGDKFVMIADGKRRESSGKVNPKMQSMKTILSACLEGDLMAMGAKKISCDENARYYVVTATLPPSDKSGIEQVVAHYDKKDGTLFLLKTVEPDGSYITYELTDKKLNQPLDGNAFAAPKKK